MDFDGSSSLYLMDMVELSKFSQKGGVQNFPIKMEGFIK